MSDTASYLDEATPDYYGSDVSSVADGMPDGFNDIGVEDDYVESDVSSATDGLTDDFNDRAEDDRIGPDPKAIMESVGDSAITDVTADGESSAYPPNTSVATDGGSSSASEPDEGSEGPLSLSNTKEELQAAAQSAGVDDSGTKQEILDRLYPA